MVEYRVALPSDAPACAEIIQAWSAETDWVPTLEDLAQTIRFWGDKFAQMPAWVAVADGRVVGVCLRDEDNIGALYVARQARGQGVGKRLLDLAKEERDWITVWAYELNTRARRFYRREGLVEIGREDETQPDGTTLVDIEHRWRRSEAG